MTRGHGVEVASILLFSSGYPRPKAWLSPLPDLNVDSLIASLLLDFTRSSIWGTTVLTQVFQKINSGNFVPTNIHVWIWKEDETKPWSVAASYVFQGSRYPRSCMRQESRKTQTEIPAWSALLAQVVGFIINISKFQEPVCSWVLQRCNLKRCEEGHVVG